MRCAKCGNEIVNEICYKVLSGKIDNENDEFKTEEEVGIFCSECLSKGI
jgi:hypothetical protein